MYGRLTWRGRPPSADALTCVPETGSPYWFAPGNQDQRQHLRLTAGNLLAGMNHHLRVPHKAVAWNRKESCPLQLDRIRSRRYGSHRKAPACVCHGAMRFLRRVRHQADINSDVYASERPAASAVDDRAREASGLRRQRTRQKQGQNRGSHCCS